MLPISSLDVLKSLNCARRDHSTLNQRCFTVALQFNSHKSVQKLFHNLQIIFSNSLMCFKVICQLEKELLKGFANVQEVFIYII